MMIQLHNITKVYGSAEATVHALAGIDLAIAKGEYCAIMGASGGRSSSPMFPVATHSL